VHIPPVDAGMDSASAACWPARTAATRRRWASEAWPRRKVPRHVAVIAGRRNAGKDVDDDEFVGPEWSVSALMGSQAWSPPAAMVSSETPPAPRQAVSMANFSL